VHEIKSIKEIKMMSGDEKCSWRIAVKKGVKPRGSSVLIVVALLGLALDTVSYTRVEATQVAASETSAAAYAGSESAGDVLSKSKVSLFNENIFWGKILTLINRHGGYIKISEFESDFDVRLLHRTRRDGYFGGYLNRDVEWYTDVDYTEFNKRVVINDVVINSGGSMSDLSLTWPRYIDNSCFSADYTSNYLAGLGWKKVAVVEDGRHANLEFSVVNVIHLLNSKTDSQITIYYDSRTGGLPSIYVNPKDGCVDAVDVKGRP
jgi:hypothetical protein